MKRLVLLLVLILGLTACSSASSSTAPATLSPVDFQELTQQPGVVVLDVRTPAEFAQGHLENAINMDVESGDFGAQIATLDSGATYAVYCRSANRSKVAMDQMKAAGFTNVQDLDGGIVAWQSQGLPVVN
jgi:rhodanese-related sulfurtransferase